MCNKDIQDKITKEKQAFIRQLSEVTGALGLWAQDKIFIDNWSIADVKIAIRNAANICGREV